LARVKERIALACGASGRMPSEVSLLPITKTFPVGAAEYAVRAGCHSVGESRVQEAVAKMQDAPPSLQWELVGHLQSNKVKLAAGRFACIQSVDSLKLLRRLDAAMDQREGSQRVLLQVNTGRDPNKFGVIPEGVEALLEEALALPRIQVDGFMTIAPLSGDPNPARRAFASLRELGVSLRERLGARLDVLSMGMSGDLEAAVREGSTLVRVGSGLFGERISP
ncbi:MAG: YggS family pyridoxal phosphate-dependent enzyme, partial [Opitutales bacterium]